MKKRILPLLLTLCMLLSLLPGTALAAGATTATDPEPMAFTDVTEGAYYSYAVAWAAKNEYVTGTTSTTFEPDTDCNRGMIVTVLWRYAGKPEPQTTTNPFTDVKETDYFCKAVLWYDGHHL